MLSENSLFSVYYRRLEKSETTYTVYYSTGNSIEGPGKANTTTNSTTTSFDAETLSQELFHLFQKDLGVYSKEDFSVMEAEGDLVSSSIALDVFFGGQGHPWGTEVQLNFSDENLQFDEKVLTEEFDKAFNRAVNARIEHYKNRENNEGIKAPRSYVQKNSGTSALALKKVVREMKADKTNLVGPRLQNGDFYSNYLKPYKKN